MFNFSAFNFNDKFFHFSLSLFLSLIAYYLSISVTYAAITTLDETSCNEKLINNTLNCDTDTQCQGTKICACQNFLNNPTGEVLSCQTGKSTCADSGHPICITPPNAIGPDPLKPGTEMNICSTGYRGPKTDLTPCIVAIEELVKKYTPCSYVCYEGPESFQLLTAKTAKNPAIYKLKNPHYNAELCTKCTQMLIPDKFSATAYPNQGTIATLNAKKTGYDIVPPPNWCVENKITGLYEEFKALKCRTGCGACFIGTSNVLYNPFTALDNDNDKIPEISPDLLRLTGLNISQTDNCPEIANPTQKDLNKNNKGCECDPDEVCVNTGNIAVCDISKPKPTTPPTTDPDCDGIPNFPLSMLEGLKQQFGNDFIIDNCPNHYNPLQVDYNKNNLGCQCDADEECALYPMCTNLRGNDNCTQNRPAMIHQERLNPGP